MIYFTTFHQFVGNLIHAVDLTSCRCNSQNQRIPYVAREDKNAPPNREHWLLTKHSQDTIFHITWKLFSGCLRHPKTVIFLQWIFCSSLYKELVAIFSIKFQFNFSTIKNEVNLRWFILPMFYCTVRNSFFMWFKCIHLTLKKGYYRKKVCINIKCYRSCFQA